MLDFYNLVYNYFLEVLKIPNCSGEEKAISDWIMGEGEKNGFECIQDELFNVLIKKPGSKGLENAEPLILQSHMDMVCVKNDDVDHDFSKDPISPIIVGDWLMAKGTSLGADDGIGVAIMLAVLMDKNLVHPPIEAIFTVGEEVSMSGAKHFNVSQLMGKKMINLDGGLEGIGFIIGAAATAKISIDVKSSKVEIQEDKFSSYDIIIKGLTGGHSGIEINKEGGNAIVLMGDLLNKMVEEKGNFFYLNEINGGTHDNAIPIECVCTVSFEENEEEYVEKIIEKKLEEYKEKYIYDEKIDIILKKKEFSKIVLTNESCNKFLKIIKKIPNGIQSINPVNKNVIDTSNNIGIVKTNENGILINNMPRSSSLKNNNEIVDKILKVSGYCEDGNEVFISNANPPLEYNEDSILKSKLEKIFKEYYNKEPLFAVMHGAIESGIFYIKMNGEVDIVSMGPNAKGFHTTEEGLSISSLKKFCDFFVKILNEING